MQIIFIVLPCWIDGFPLPQAVKESDLDTVSPEPWVANDANGDVDYCGARRSY